MEISVFSMHFDVSIGTFVLVALSGSKDAIAIIKNKQIVMNDIIGFKNSFMLFIKLDSQIACLCVLDSCIFTKINEIGSKAPAIMKIRSRKSNVPETT